MTNEKVSFFRQWDSFLVLSRKMKLTSELRDFYMALLWLWNKNFHKKTFYVSGRLLQRLYGVSKNNSRKYLQKLHDLELIVFQFGKQKSRVTIRLLYSVYEYSNNQIKVQDCPGVCTADVRYGVHNLNKENIHKKIYMITRREKKILF